MKRLLFLAALAGACFFSTAASAQGVRRLTAPQQCGPGGCPTPEVSAPSVSASNTGSASCGTASADRGWYPGKFAARICERVQERRAARGRR